MNPLSNHPLTRYVDEYAETLPRAIERYFRLDLSISTETLNGITLAIADLRMRRGDPIDPHAAAAWIRWYGQTVMEQLRKERAAAEFLTMALLLQRGTRGGDA